MLPANAAINILHHAMVAEPTDKRGGYFQHTNVWRKFDSYRVTTLTLGEACLPGHSIANGAMSNKRWYHMIIQSVIEMFISLNNGLGMAASCINLL